MSICFPTRRNTTNIDVYQQILLSWSRHFSWGPLRGGEALAPQFLEKINEFLNLQQIFNNVDALPPPHSPFLNPWRTREASMPKTRSQSCGWQLGMQGKQATMLLDVQQSDWGRWLCIQWHLTSDHSVHRLTAPAPLRSAALAGGGGGSTTGCPRSGSRANVAAVGRGGRAACIHHWIHLQYSYSSYSVLNHCVLVTAVSTFTTCTIHELLNYFVNINLRGTLSGGNSPNLLIFIWP